MFAVLSIFWENIIGEKLSKARTAASGPIFSREFGPDQFPENKHFLDKSFSKPEFLKSDISFVILWFSEN